MSETGVSCGVKHTRPQIPDADWLCPKCGIGAEHKSGGFVIEDPASEECSQLHDDDGIYCSNCGFGASGKSFARLYAKAKSLVPCEHCHGTGLVKAIPARLDHGEDER